MRASETEIAEWSEHELNELSINTKEFWSRALGIWARPFKMLATEPIVLFLSLISGFSDALIFTFLYAMGMVTDQWDFEAWQNGLCFVPIGLGYIACMFLWMWDIKRQSRWRQDLDRHPERRLKALLFIAPMLPIFMLIFAWLATGPPRHWVVLQIPLFFIGMANYALYGLTVDYMV